jgi:hypothetical protein
MTAGDLEARDRVALLQHCADGIEEHERRALSVRRPLPVLGWSVLLAAVALAGSEGGENGTTAGWLVLLVGLWLVVARIVPGPPWVGHAAGALGFVVAGAATLPLVEGAGSGPATALLVLGWAAAAAGAVLATVSWVATVRSQVAAAAACYSRRREPALRDRGPVSADPGVATAFDLRHRPDFEEQAGQLVARANARLYSLRAALPPIAFTVTGVLGVVLSAGAAGGMGSGPWRWAVLASGLVLMAGYGFALVSATLGVLWHRQLEANRVLVETEVYGRQRALALSLPRPPRASLGIGGAAGLLLAVLWLGILAARLRTGSGLALAISLGIVLVAALGVTAWSVARRRTVRVFPLDGDGPGLLQAPGRAVVTSRTEDGIEIAPATAGTAPVRLSRDDVLGVLDLPAVHPFSGPAVALLTEGSPVVLVGTGVGDLPALQELRERTGTGGR